MANPGSIVSALRKCIEDIEHLSESERLALALEYWEFVDERRRQRTSIDEEENTMSETYEGQKVEVYKDALKQMYDALCAAEDLYHALRRTMDSASDSEEAVYKSKKAYDAQAELFFLFNPIGAMFEDMTDKNEI